MCAPPAAPPLFETEHITKNLSYSVQWTPTACRRGWASLYRHSPDTECQCGL